MRNAHKYIILVLIILLWSCVSVRANEVSVLHLLKDFYANGNPISVEDTTANTLRVMQWDEENRLQSLGDDGYVSRYTYNHAGERVIKSHGPTTVAFVNGAPQGILWHDKDNWTMYVNPYMVVNSDRFTKHYYAGNQRIASKIGAGEFNNLYDASKACVTAGQKDYAERLNLITQSRNDYYAALGIPPGPPTAKGIYGEAEYSGMYGEYVIEPLGDYSVPTGWPMKPYKRPYGGTPGAPVMYEKPSDPEDEGAGYGYSNAEGLEENDIYFYHSDHLGSTSYITDKDGNATQFVSYKPYGEALVDEHNTSYEQPWKFNGKELDSETGLYYYGARYYEPVLAMWYGVDALAEKYPNIGGYVYCAGNPVKLVDLDGDSPTLATAAIGAVLGGIVGGAIEIGSQLYQNGEVSDWSAVGGASAQGAITGAAAGLTCGASLLVTTSVSGTANVLGGTVNRTIQGQDTNLNDVLSDATIGAVFGAGGKLIGNGVNCFSSVQSQATNQLNNIASKVLTNMGPGKGSVYGTKVHSAFAKAANGLKIGDCTIRTEVSYLNGKVVAYGTKGSARIDAGLYNSKGELIQVFDLKTGGAKLTSEQVKHIQTQTRTQVTVTEIRGD